MTSSPTLLRVRGSFRDQLERAVLSASNNIAEGFERGTTNELLSSDRHAETQKCAESRDGGFFG